MKLVVLGEKTTGGKACWEHRWEGQEIYVSHFRGRKLGLPPRAIVMANESDPRL